MNNVMYDKILDELRQGDGDGGGGSGADIISLTSTSITPQDGAVFKKTLAADDAFTISTSGLAASKQVAFELHLIQPSPAVSFTLPNALIWGDGSSFDRGNPPPVMTTADTEYCIKILWDGSDLLALAYSKAVVSNLPLTLSAAQADSRVTLNATGSPNVSRLYYRPGKSGPWIPYSIGTPIPLDNIGDSVQFWNDADTLSSGASHHVQFSMNGGIYASGNLMSMLNFGTVCKTGSFYGLFRECTALLSAPDLPASTIEGLGMADTFRGCTNMTGTIDLQAQTLTGESSCLSAFYGCSHLTGAVIRATQLATGCLAYAFYGCSALNSVEVNFTEWLSGATTGWMGSVAGSGTFIKPTDLEDTRGSNNIPSGNDWTVVNK